MARLSPALKATICATRMGDKIITPRLTAFLMSHPNIDLDEWVVAKITDALNTKARNRSGSFSSSAAGTCPRAQVFKYMGAPAPTTINPQLANIFIDGRWRHLRWQALLLQAIILTDIEISLPWPDKRSMGSMDGIGVVPEDHAVVRWRGLEFGFELKGANMFVYKDIVAKGPIQFLAQVARYFLSGGFPLFVILVEDKNTQAWEEWVYEVDPVLLEEQRAELDMLNDHVDRKRLPVLLDECKEFKGRAFNNCDYGGRLGICQAAGSRWPTATGIKAVAKAIEED